MKVAFFSYEVDMRNRSDVCQLVFRGIAHSNQTAAKAMVVDSEIPLCWRLGGDLFFSGSAAEGHLLHIVDTISSLATVRELVMRRGAIHDLK
jgi:hypothetical protein